MADDIEAIGKLLDAYAVGHYMLLPSAPPEMQTGEAKDDWLGWRMLPSKVTEADVREIEAEFNIQFPPVFRSYLMARFHLFDQVVSGKHDQQIMQPALSCNRPLKEIRSLIRAWEPLTHAGYIPFAEWGDGWGPMCFDTLNRRPDGDCPVVWMDHEQLIPLGEEACRSRDALQLYIKPLYDSGREFLWDVFTSR